MDTKKNIIRDSDVVKVFEIPDELARELSEVVTKISIRQNLLVEVIDKPGKFEEIETSIIPLQERKNALMNLVTRNYVPEEYRSERYSWFFPGYSIAGNECWIKET